MARILLLEPNKLLADQTKEFLEEAGHEVNWAQNAQKAINVADSKKPDIVVMEILLAAHSGIEFLHEFRSYAEWRSVPVIIFSRLPRDDLKTSDSALNELGVTRYLYKLKTSLHRLAEQIAAFTEPAFGP